jgi:hypothetical protein
VLFCTASAGAVVARNPPKGASATPESGQGGRVPRGALRLQAHLQPARDGCRVSTQRSPKHALQVFIQQLSSSRLGSLSPSHIVTPPSPSSSSPYGPKTTTSPAPSLAPGQHAHPAHIPPSPPRSCRPRTTTTLRRGRLSDSHNHITNSLALSLSFTTSSCARRCSPLLLQAPFPLRHSTYLDSLTHRLVCAPLPITTHATIAPIAPIPPSHSSSPPHHSDPPCASPSRWKSEVVQDFKVGCRWLRRTNPPVRLCRRQRLSSDRLWHAR